MMETNILVLDFELNPDVNKSLLDILESSKNFNVQLQQIYLQDSDKSSVVESLLSKIASFNPNLVFLIFPKSLLHQIIGLLQKLGLNKVPLIVIYDGGEIEDILALFKKGVNDYISLPLHAIDIFPRIWRLLETGSNKAQLSQIRVEQLCSKQLIGESEVFLDEVRKIPMVARCDASILVMGETGTGKEVFARTIHYLSQRASKPFIPVNCGAIPLDLIENELFGHERGAYTGASSSYIGLIREAEAGTLFLDEINCLPTTAQVKLLRFLQNREYRPVGSTKTCKADVRIIAATNEDLKQAVKKGDFRHDLYYRLNVIPLHIPPLRYRLGDVILLAHHFLSKFAVDFNKDVKAFSSNAIQLLLSYDWPGNVRELEHAVERAVVLSTQSVIQKTDLSLSDFETPVRQVSFREMKSRIIEQFEKTYIRELLLVYQGNITKAAQAAQKDRRAFWQLIRKHQIDKENFRSIKLGL
jgi:two-component system response regulator GlrR